MKTNTLQALYQLRRFLEAVVPSVRKPENDPLQRVPTHEGTDITLPFPYSSEEFSSAVVSLDPITPVKIPTIPAPSTGSSSGSLSSSSSGSSSGSLGPPSSSSSSSASSSSGSGSIGPPAPSGGGSISDGSSSSGGSGSGSGGPGDTSCTGPGAASCCDTIRLIAESGATGCNCGGNSGDPQYYNWFYEGTAVFDGFCSFFPSCPDTNEGRPLCCCATYCPGGPFIGGATPGDGSGGYFLGIPRCDATLPGSTFPDAVLVDYFCCYGGGVLQTISGQPTVFCPCCTTDTTGFDTCVPT